MSEKPPNQGQDIFKKDKENGGNIKGKEFEISEISEIILSRFVFIYFKVFFNEESFQKLEQILITKSLEEIKTKILENLKLSNPQLRDKFKLKKVFFDRVLVVGFAIDRDEILKMKKDWLIRASKDYLNRIRNNTQILSSAIFLE